MPLEKITRDIKNEGKFIQQSQRLLSMSMESVQKKVWLLWNSEIAIRVMHYAIMHA